MKGIKVDFAEERIEVAIERAAATEERKLNDIRWKNSEDQQRRTVQQLKELIEKQELVRVSIENENAARKRHERSECIGNLFAGFISNNWK